MPEPGEVSNGRVWTGDQWIELRPESPVHPADEVPSTAPEMPMTPVGRSLARWLWPVVVLAAVLVLSATAIIVVLLTRSTGSDSAAPSSAQASAAGALLDSILENARVLDTTKLESQIGAELTTRIGDTIVVDCPKDQPVEKGYTFECVASDTSGTKRIVVITEDDDQGNVTWELTDREP